MQPILYTNQDTYERDQQSRLFDSISRIIRPKLKYKINPVMSHPDEIKKQPLLQAARL